MQPSSSPHKRDSRQQRQLREEIETLRAALADVTSQKGEIEQALASEQEERKSKSTIEGQLRKMRFEMGQLDMVRVAREDELRALKEKVRTQEKELASKTAALTATAQLAKEHEELKERYRQSKAAMSAAEKGRRAAESDATRQNASNRELLERLLAEQRKSFEKQVATLERDAARTQEQVVRLEDQINTLEAALGLAREELVEARTRIRIADGAAKSRGVSERANNRTPVSPPNKKEKPVKRRRTGPLAHVVLDESRNAPPIAGQILEALRSNAAKVIDSFRNGHHPDGKVTRAAFESAMPALGLEVTTDAIDEVFDALSNSDGGNTLTLKELGKLLQSPAGGTQTTSSLQASTPQRGRDYSSKGPRPRAVA
jgi:hypothetical protein